MILVTGGAGFIGSHIVAELERRDMGPIAVCDRFGSEGKWRNLVGLRLYAVIDPADMMTWINAQLDDDSLDAIIHMGAITSTSECDADALIENNSCLTTNLFVLSAAHNIPFIYASSASVYGAAHRQTDEDNCLDSLLPLCPYGWSKKLADQMILARARTFRKWAGLRFFNIYGPNEGHKGDQKSYVSKCLSQLSEPIKRFDGSNVFRRDWVWVGDCARLVCDLLQMDGLPGIINVGTGESRSFDEVISACGVSVNTVAMSASLRDQYQAFTEAKTEKFRRIFPDFKFSSLEEGIELYRQAIAK